MKHIFRLLGIGLGLISSLALHGQDTLTIEGFCYGDTTVFSWPGLAPDVELSWDLGEPGLSPAKGHRVKHHYAIAGNYEITVQKCRGNQCDTLLRTIQIYPNLEPDWPLERPVPPDTITVLDAGSPQARHYWSTRDSSQQLTVLSVTVPIYYVVWIQQGPCRAEKGIRLYPVRGTGTGEETTEQASPQVEGGTYRWLDTNGKVRASGEAFFTNPLPGVAALPNGFWLLQIQTPQGWATRKVQVKR